ncbi:MAG: hypothetical protein E7310_06515 [Clostridiales bacterium]|nr:hypothetical protein [Clostridiales bacterium]
MEERIRSKLIKIEVGDKEYTLGFPTRKDAKRAEDLGLDLVNNGGKLITLNDKIFYTGLLAKHPSITEYEAEKILEQYRAENGDTDEVINFLVGQYMAFMRSPDGKKKKAKILEM